MKKRILLVFSMIFLFSGCAGFGVSSFRTIWLYKGNVTGVIA